MKDCKNLAPNSCLNPPKNETLDLINELKKMGIPKENRNIIIEDIIKNYGRSVRIESIASFDNESDFGFEEKTGNVIKSENAKKRIIKFKEHYPYLF